MADQGRYYQSQSGGELPSTNPWAEETGPQHNQPHLQQPLQPQQAQQAHQQYQPQQGYHSQQGGYSSQQSYQMPQEDQTQQWSTETTRSSYQPPPGLPPRRTDTFQDENIVPAEERGEQREAMETFEMNKTKPESEADRAVAALQSEFPAIDGSLIAALFSDSQNVGATREMLQELASSQS